MIFLFVSIKTSHVLQRLLSHFKYTVEGRRMDGGGGWEWFGGVLVWTPAYLMLACLCQQHEMGLQTMIKSYCNY